MVSLLVAVLNHNNLVETEHQDDISFYTEQVYRQLQKNYPEYGITEEEIENDKIDTIILKGGSIYGPCENRKLYCRKKKKTWYDSKTAC